MTVLSNAQREYLLTNRTLGHATIRRATATSHNEWLAGFLAKSPMEKDRFRPVKNKPGDDAYLAEHSNNPILVREIEGKPHINILLPFALLAPTGEAMNSAAAVDDFSIVADAIIAGKVVVGQEVDSVVMESLSDAVHDRWCKRESWREDEDFKRLNVPYVDLPDDEKEKDRVRVRNMLVEISKDFPS